MINWDNSDLIGEFSNDLELWDDLYSPFWNNLDFSYILLSTLIYRYNSSKVWFIDCYSIQGKYRWYTKVHKMCIRCWIEFFAIKKIYISFRILPRIIPRFIYTINVILDIHIFVNRTTLDRSRSQNWITVESRKFIKYFKKLYKNTTFSLSVLVSNLSHR